MNQLKRSEDTRRRFLQWLSASPVLALPGMQDALAQDFAKPADPMVWPATIPDDRLIKAPGEASNVFDFEPVAYKTCRPRTLATWRWASTMR